MEFQQALQIASSATEVVRARKNLLYTFGNTRLPYICLSDSPANEGDIVIRSGEVSAERPSIAIPGGNDHQFEGFAMDPEDAEAESLMQIFLARRIEMPAAKYVNTADSTVTERGPMEGSVERVVNRLDQASDSRTAVITTPDKVWPIAILLYVGSQVVRSAPSNIAEHFEHLRMRGEI